jgi:hypothetical protein
MGILTAAALRSQAMSRSAAGILIVVNVAARQIDTIGNVVPHF